MHLSWIMLCSSILNLTPELVYRHAGKCELWQFIFQCLKFQTGLLVVTSPSCHNAHTMTELLIRALVHVHVLWMPWELVLLSECIIHVDRVEWINFSINSIQSCSCIMLVFISMPSPCVGEGTWHSITIMVISLIQNADHVRQVKVLL